jgi:hypothetical protein
MTPWDLLKEMPNESRRSSPTWKKVGGKAVGFKEDYDEGKVNTICVECWEHYLESLWMI